MRNFKEILLFLLIFSAILAPFALFERFSDTYVLYPTRSAPHTLNFVSYVKYYESPVITLRQYDRQGELLCENELAITTGIFEQQVQEYEFPEWIGESVDLCVNLHGREPPLPVIHFPSTSELEKTGVLIYLLNDTALDNTDGLMLRVNASEQYVYFISGRYQRVFYWSEGSDRYGQVWFAPPMKIVPPYHPYGDGVFVEPRADWKEHTWVTTGADG